MDNAIATMNPLIELPTCTLLDRFGLGKHAPGSGSAAALMGLIAANLVVTVSSLTLRKPAYKEHHVAIGEIREEIESELIPALLDLFQRDAEAFDEVFKARIARDAAHEDKERCRLDAVALEKLRSATKIPFQIGSICLKLIDHAAALFDKGFKSARGDSGAAISAAIAGGMSSVFIINLNLNSFCGSYWAKQARLQSNALLRNLSAQHEAALKRGIEPGEIGSSRTILGSFEAEPQNHYSDIDIQERVKQLHRFLWQNRRSIWEGDLPPNIVPLLDPALALGLLGYAYEVEETLGYFRTSEGSVEVAGLFEPQNGRVKISHQFPQNVRNFTAAHELGHAVLHSNMANAHRDKPMDGAIRSRERSELEADKFATYFLMPEQSVRKRFAENFGVEFFTLNDQTSFALTGNSLHEALKKFHTPRDLSRHLASTDRFNRQQVIPLAVQFQVSYEALAIRLEELNLLRI